MLGFGLGLGLGLGRGEGGFGVRDLLGLRILRRKPVRLQDLRNQRSGRCVL